MNKHDCYNCADEKVVPTVMACPDCGQPEPQLGMGGTLQFLNDRVPVTVVEVLSPKRIIVQRDHVKNDGSFAVSTVNGEDLEFSLRKDGRWREKGNPNGTTLRLGKRDYYRCREF